jgi:hypothetical protein
MLAGQHPVICWAEWKIGRATDGNKDGAGLSALLLLAAHFPTFLLMLKIYAM